METVQPLVEQAAAARWAGQWAYLWERSEFYRRKFREAGLRPAPMIDLAHLSDLPFTTKDELRASQDEAPPLGLHLAASPSDIVQVQASSGTTGRPSFVGLTRRDLETWTAMAVETFTANGLEPGMWCAHAFALSRGFVGGWPLVQALQAMGIGVIPVGAEAGAARFAAVLDRLRPQALVGAPHFLLYLAGQVEEILGRPAAALGVRRISTGGEPGGGIPSVRRALEAAWGARVREMMGGADLGAIYWGECSAALGMHFFGGERLWVELVAPDTGMPVPMTPGARGELVYTALDREASPLVRFRSGDIVEVTADRCSCGRPGSLVRCLGRTDDMLIVRGVNVFPSALQDVVLRLAPRVTGRIRIMADFEGHATNRPLQVEVEAAGECEAAIDPRLPAQVEQAFRDCLAVRTKVIVVPAGALAGPPSGKAEILRRVSS